MANHRVKFDNKVFMAWDQDTRCKICEAITKYWISTSDKHINRKSTSSSQQT